MIVYIQSQKKKCESQERYTKVVSLNSKKMNMQDTQIHTHTHTHTHKNTYMYIYIYIYSICIYNVSPNEKIDPQYS